MTKRGAETLDEAEMTAALRANLASDDRALARALPVVSYMLINPGQPFVSDDVIARIRGMIGEFARQLSSNCDEHDSSNTLALESMLMERSGLVNHCYALAVEAVLTEQLSEDQGIDPALPALLQELIASRDANISQLAMALMESQTRFAEGQRRANISIFELPAVIFDEALTVWRGWALKHHVQSLVKAESELRHRYVEAETRIGILGQLIDVVGASADIISEIETAGLALFISAIAQATGQPRDLFALSCQKQQCLRIAIALKAVGRPTEAIMRQLTLLGVDFCLPSDFSEWSERQALVLLETSSLGALPGSKATHEHG